MGDLAALQPSTAGALVRATGLANVSTHQTDVDDVVVYVAHATAGARTALLVRVHNVTVLLLKATFPT